VTRPSRGGEHAGRDQRDVRRLTSQKGGSPCTGGELSGRGDFSVKVHNSAGAHVGQTRTRTTLRMRIPQPVGRPGTNHGKLHRRNQGGRLLSFGKVANGEVTGARGSSPNPKNATRAAKQQVWTCRCAQEPSTKRTASCSPARRTLKGRMGALHADSGGRATTGRPQRRRIMRHCVGMLRTLMPVERIHIGVTSWR